MRNRPSIVLATLLIFTLVTATTAAVDDDMATIAKLGTELLAIWTTEDRDAADSRRERQLEERLLQMFEPILGLEPSEEEAMDMLRAAFDLHAPDQVARLDAFLGEADARNTRGWMLGLVTALEMHRATNGSFPSAERGLVALLEDGTLPAAMLTDGWGRGFLYTPDGEHAYVLRSKGPDGVAGNADDLLADETGEVRSAAPKAELKQGAAVVHASLADLGMVKVYGSVPRGAVVDHFVLGSSSMAYAARAADGWFVGFGDQRGPTFDKVTAPELSDDGNAIIYLGKRGEDVFIIEGDVMHAAGGRWPGWAAVADSDDFVITGYEEDGDTFCQYQGKRLEMDWLMDAVRTEDDALLAFRQRVHGRWVMHVGGETLGPFDWVSRPVGIHDGVEMLAFWRSWTSEKGTTLHVNRNTFAHHDWIGEPAMSTERVAWAVTDGGQPADNFQWRRTQGADMGDPIPVYEGGVERMIVDGEPQDEFAYVGTPLLSSDGKSIAYTAKEADGRWRVVREGRPGPVSPGVSGLVWDRSGHHVAYVSHEVDGAHLVVDGEAGPPFDEIEQLRAGSRYFLATGIGNGQRFLMSGTRVLGSFDTVEITTQFGLDEPYAVGLRDGKKYVSFGDTPTGPWDRLASPVVSEDGKTVAYGGLDDEGWHMVVNGRPGAAFPAVGEPRITSDGRVVYVAITGTEVDRFTPDPGYPSAMGDAEYQVVVGDEPGPPHGYVGDIAVGPGGSVAYVGYGESDDDPCHVYCNGTKGPDMDMDPDGLMFLTDGTLVYDVQTEEGSRFLFGDVAGPRFDEVSLGTLEPDATRWCYSYWSGDETGYAGRGFVGPAFDWTGQCVVSDDGVIAYRGARGGAYDDQGNYSGGRWHVVIGQWVSPPFDAVSDPEGSSDRYVTFSAQRGRELVSVTVDRSKLGARAAQVE